MGGSGALYLMVRLPAPNQQSERGEDAGKNGNEDRGAGGDDELVVVDDEAVVEWLAREHGVCVIPGTACGLRGYVRVCFANLPPAQCEEAARRLERGLAALPQSSLYS